MALAFNLLQRISIMFNKWPMGTSNKLITFWMYSSLVQGNVHLPLDWLIGCCSNNTFLRIFQSCGNIPIADENLAIATFDSWSIRSLISNIVHWLNLYVSVIYLPWVHDLSWSPDLLWHSASVFWVSSEGQTPHSSPLTVSKVNWGLPTYLLCKKNDYSSLNMVEIGHLVLKIIH